jgi:hypothetical protein
MGTSVCTYHIRDCTQNQCLKALALVKSPAAFVSAATNNWLTLVDENAESFQLELLEKTIAALSKNLSTTIIETGVYDDDESFYVVFQAGIEIDRFATSHDVYDWLGRQKFSGNPKQLAERLPWWNGQASLATALKKNYKLEASRLKDIVRAFGIPESRAFTKMRDLTRPLPAPVIASIPPESELGRQLRDRQQYKPFPTTKEK